MSEDTCMDKMIITKGIPVEYKGQKYLSLVYNNGNIDVYFIYRSKGAFFRKRRWICLNTKKEIKSHQIIDELNITMKKIAIEVEKNEGVPSNATT